MISTNRVWGKARRWAIVLIGVPGLAAAGFFGISGCEQLGVGYVGTNTCLACHNGGRAPDKREFLQSPHAANGCESCHGPGYAHVRNGGRYGLLIAEGAEAAAKCAECHPDQMNEFQQSVHAKEKALDCADCHDPHMKEATMRPIADNQLCLQCHAYLEFPTQADIEAHTYHDYDPVVTGQSRCVRCHMVPAQRADQDQGAHRHSLIPVPPISSNQAGVTPAPPNSCAGIMGCHDGSVITAPVFDVDDPKLNEQLQILYDARYGA